MFPPKCFPYTAATYQIDIPSFLWHGFDNYFDFDNYDYDYKSFLPLLASCTYDEHVWNKDYDAVHRQDLNGPWRPAEEMACL